MYLRHHPSPNPSPSRGGERSKQRAFTLLEVILALVILGAALAMLGEVMQLATRHAVDSRAETQAQILAASVMDQVISGSIEASGATREPLDVDDDATQWLYSITIGTSDVTGIMPVEVLIEQDLEPQQTPVKFRLFRWLPTVREMPESASPGAGGGPAGGQPPGGTPSGLAPSGAGAQTL